jgi:hypothetical protein
MTTATSNLLGEIPHLTPRWLRLPQAVAYSGISRAKLYAHLTEGRIRAACVQESPTTRGTRLFDRLSIDEFLLSTTTSKSPAVGLGSREKATEGVK